jgi:hypothetical protein
MKYFFTTLAVNEPYFSKSLNFHKELSEKTENAYFNITTTQNDINRYEQENSTTLEEELKLFPKIGITTIEELNKSFTFPLNSTNPAPITFHLNLKVLSIKSCLKSDKDFDYLIYIDGDWHIHENFSESKIFKSFEIMEEMEIDFAYERPHQIGPSKIDVNCFFPNKIIDYSVLEHDYWDLAQVPNEQFMIFKKNYKLNYFTMRWEQFLWYCVANDLMCYPDGFEIGVSALESKMKMEPVGILSQLTECFYFYTRWADNKNIRF